jgi:hypothetical protein
MAGTAQVSSSFPATFMEMKCKLVNFFDFEYLERECPIFCVTAIWSMLPERSKDDDHIQGTAGRTTEGLRAA